MAVADRRLRLEFGLVSAQGRRSDNQDYAAFCPGPPGSARGSVAAVADGLGGHKGGREAAETTVRAFLDGYYGAAERHAPAQAASRALEAVNSWIVAQGRSDPDLHNMATTFTALLFVGGEAHVLHVGDTRAYRLTASQLEQLTVDHVVDTGEFALPLERAVGFAAHLRIEHAVLDLAPRDRFLLCSDGLHGVLSPSRIAAILREAGAPDEAARQLRVASLEAGSTDNVTAIVIDIVDTPPATRQDLFARLTATPVATPPERGETIDGFRIDAVLADTPRHRTVRATDLHSNKLFALKFPRPSDNKAAQKAAFVQAAWVAFRTAHPAIGETITLPAGRQTRLYSVAPFYDGETLAARVRDGRLASLTEGVALATQLARALAHLHRRGVVHGGVCGDHVILLRDGGLRLIGLGHSGGGDRESEAMVLDLRPESAPELVKGGEPGEKTDIYALGVTCFRMFAGEYPGKRKLSALRPDLPSWLGAALASAMADEPDQRPEDAYEFVYELERQEPDAGRAPKRAKPLFERHPLLFWRLVSLGLFVALILSLVRR
jgi:serine/threonine protein phosphatase PrpC